MRSPALRVPREPEGSYTAEKDSAGCFFPGERETLRLPEEIASNKEFCDCSFRWRFTENDAAQREKSRCPCALGVFRYALKLYH